MFQDFAKEFYDIGYDIFTSSAINSANKTSLAFMMVHTWLAWMETNGNRAFGLDMD